MFWFQLLIGWFLVLCLAGKAAGYTEKVSFRWHPALWLVEWPLLRAHLFHFVTSTIFLLVLAVFSLKAPERIVSVIEAIELFILLPVPWFIIDIIRRDTGIRFKEFIFFDCFEPVGTRYKRSITAGRLEEKNPTIYLYIDDEDWQSILAVNKANRNYLETFAVKNTLYLFKALGNNEFMQFFDSLQLYKFVVHPGNVKAMTAFERAMRAARTPPADFQTTPPPVTTPAKPVVTPQNPKQQPAQQQTTLPQPAVSTQVANASSTPIKAHVEDDDIFASIPEPPEHIDSDLSSPSQNPSTSETPRPAVTVETSTDDAENQLSLKGVEVGDLTDAQRDAGKGVFEKKTRKAKRYDSTPPPGATVVPIAPPTD